MAYTLAMPTDQDPKIAADGVQEVPLTRARPLLTRLIEQALEDKLDSALTVRGRRRAYLVRPDFYEKAREDRRMVLATMDYIEAKLSAQPDSQAIAELAEFASHLGAQRSD